MPDLLDDPRRVAEVDGVVRSGAATGPVLEDLLQEAAQVAGAPMATLNLLDADTQHQTATCGFSGSSSPRDESMCAMSMRIGGFVHVPDASRDSRFADSPWVDGRRADVRFYAAAPLVAASGSVLGTLCVFDVQAHELDGDQREQLTDLADRVVAVLAERTPAAGE